MAMGRYENQIIHANQNYFSDLNDNAIEAAEYFKQSTQLSTYHFLNNPNFNNSSDETTIRRDIYKKKQECYGRKRCQWMP